MKIHVLNNAKKKKFTLGLSYLGIKKIPQLLVRSGKERIRAYSGHLDTEKIMDIWKILPIEGVGLYVGKDLINRNGVHEIRLSLDGMHTWKEQLTKKILILTEKQEEDWFFGKDIDLEERQTEEVEQGFVSVKSSDEKDFIGVGKIGGDRKTLFSFLPKERRRKSQTI